MPPTSGTRKLNLTLLTVCLDPASLGHALATAEDAGWVLQEAHFDSYISQRRRPYLGNHLHTGDGCLALIDYDADPHAAAEATAFLHQVFAGRLAVVALSSLNTPEAILFAMRAGAAEYLIRPTDPAELQAAFARVEEHFGSVGAAVHKAGSILAFSGAKGGVGSTTLALHLATFLVHKGKKVLLIDNHVQFGHACIYLGIDGSEAHFQELVRNVGRLDSELLPGFLATHTSGLDVLSSPDLGKTARPMHPDDVAGTLEFLRGEYDFILVDCAATLDDVTRTVVLAATQVYVVATPEISAIRDLSRHVDDLANLTEVKEKVCIVLNRYSSQFAIGLDVVEKAVRLPISFCIPNNYVELVQSANLGVPVDPESTSGFAQDMRHWANSLLGVREPSALASAPRSSSNAWESLKGSLHVLLGPSPAVARKRA